MSLYYEDEYVQLHHGRCEDILPTLSLSGDVHLLTDPPYFQVKNEAWDNQWSKAAEFLDWMGGWLGLVKPHLSANASVWVFASPQLTSAVESVVAQQFRVLNSIRWVKQGSTAHRMSLDSARSFVPFWEGIIFAEQPLTVGEYMASEWRRAGMADRDIGPALGFNARLATLWAAGERLPGPDAYMRLAAMLGDGYLDAPYERRRRPFAVTRRETLGDIWHFPSVPADAERHPCEKPVSLLAHMIETSTRPGDTIIDCFAGSGAVLDVARQLGRKAVGIEMDAHWCGEAAKRLSQQAFIFEGMGA